MRRRVIQYQNRWLIYVLAEIVYRVDQELAIDVGRAFIRHAKIVRSKDAEQIHLLVTSRKNLDALAFW